MVLKTTFGQSQKWSLIRGILCVENEKKNNFNFTNKAFNGQDVLILGGLNSGISLYLVSGEFLCRNVSPANRKRCNRSVFMQFIMTVKKGTGQENGDKSRKFVIFSVRDCLPV